MAAGRGIGSVHVDVEADTSGVKPEVVRAFKSAGEAGGRAAKDAINDELGEIGGPKLKAALKKIREQIERGLDDLDISLEFDEAQLRADIKKLQAMLERQELELEIDPDLESVFQELKALDAYLDAKHPELKIDPDIESPAQELKALQARLDAMEVEVAFAPGGQERRKGAADAKLRSNFSDVGRQSGSLFAGGFGEGMSTRWKAIIAAIAGLMEPAAVLLEGLAASLTSVLSSSVFAVGAGAAAATPLLVGLVAAVGGVVLAMQGMGDAMSAIAEEDAEAFATALEKLSPAAAEFATAVQGVWEQFDALRGSPQEKLFAGRAAAYTSLATDTIPELNEGLGAIIQQVSQFAEQMFGVLERVDFGKMLGDLAPSVSNILDGLRELIEGFFEFITVATPFAETLSEWFKTWATDVGNFGNEKVVDFLERGMDALELWFDLLGGISDALATILEAGQASG